MENQVETTPEFVAPVADLLQPEETKSSLVLPLVTETPKPKLDPQGRAYATGKRKTSIARVWLWKGPGEATIRVNKQEIEKYFPRRFWLSHIKEPLFLTEVADLHIMATVTGGGKTGQAGALRYGISRALLNYDPSLRPLLRKAGMLTRDARIVERKKYGLRKARRRFQFSKR